MAKFAWPSVRGATDEQKRALSASLQELMKEKGITHMQLVDKLSMTPGAIRQPLMARGFITSGRAKRFAKFFGVPLDRLQTPKGPFTPYMGVRKRKDGLKDNPANNPQLAVTSKSSEVTSEAATGVSKAKRKYTKRTNGHAHDDNDTRWILPIGVEPPHVKMETSKKRAQMNIIECKAEVPPEVAMGVYSLLNGYKLEKPDEA